MKISTRLTLLFILVAVLPLALFSYLNLQQDEATLRNEVLGRMSDLADKKESQVKNYLAERKQDVAFLTRSSSVIEALDIMSREYVSSRRNAPVYMREDARMGEYFKRYIKESGLFYDAFLINPQGDIAYTHKHEADFATSLITGPYRDTQLAQVFRDVRMTLEPVISGYQYYPPSRMPALFIAAPIMTEGKFNGVFAVQLDNALLYRVATDATGLGRSGEATFAQRDGDGMLYTMPLKYHADAAMKFRLSLQQSKSIPTLEALRGNTGVGVRSDYRGVNVAAAWRYLPELDWGMVVKVDADEVFAPIYQQRTLMLEVLFGLLLLSALAGYWFARQVSSPLLKLTDNAAGLARGDFSLRADEAVPGEMGVLARAFNRMAENLQQLYGTLEARIEQRTIELANSEKLLDSLVANIPVMVFVKRASDLRFEKLNRAGEVLLGFSEAELLGKNDYDFFPREQADFFTAIDRDVLVSHQLKDIPLEDILTRNGETRILHTRKIGIYDEAGEPTHLLGVSVDITDQKRAEAALQYERDFASGLLDAAPAIVMLLDPQGCIRQVNHYFEQLSGYLLDEIKGKAWTATFLPEREQGVICTLLHAVLHQTKMSGSVSRIVTRSGEERQIEWSTQPIYDSHGKVSDMLCVGQDVTERNIKEQMLRNTADRLNEAQRIAQMGNWELDLVQGTLTWSDEIFNLFEIDKAQFPATYEAFLNAIHPDDRDAVNQAYTRSLENRAPYEIIHRLRMSDGRIKWVQERCSSDFAADGKPLRSVGTVQDITERKQHEAELLRFNEELEQRVVQRTAQLSAAKEEAELASRSKSLFLTSMSHELRTPLNAILGYAQLMQLNPELPEHVIEDANEIKHAGDYLLALLNDVLDLARIESGRMEIQSESFALSEVLAQCHKQNLQAAGARNIALVDEGRCDVIVVADRRRILQVLNNLVSNAIKYNRDGGRVSISCGTGPDGRVRIAVTDTGPGIAPDMQVQLFQPFNRLGAEMSKIQGTGVGLAISRRLIEAMDGRIGVDSIQGEGSTFWVELPTSQHAVVLPAPRPMQPSKPPRVLVVEDYAPNQNLLRAQLQTLGCEVELACDGAEALQKYRAGRYDLILTDLNMPVMDGTALAIAIRQDEAGKGGHIPIIAITAAAVSSELKRCRAAGMDDTLTKPLALDGLRSALTRWLGTAALTVVLDQPGGATPGSGDAVLNLDHLYRALGQVNLAEARSLIATFIGSAAQGLSQLASNINDGVAVSREMHKQKSSARTVGALRYAQLADALEQHTKGGVTSGLTESLAALREALAEIEQAALGLDKFVVTETPVLMDKTALSCHSALVVDDDPVVLQQITGMLTTLGLDKVLVARNGAEALRVLAAQHDKVEVLLCDLNMPEMDGVELIREFGRSGFDGGVILISGEDEKVLSTVSRLAELQGLRVLGQLHKPVTPAKFIPLLSRIAAAPGQKRQVPVAPTVSPDDIRAGIAANEFSIWFQPKVDSAGLRALGVEALARWKRKDGSYVPPDIFIVAAEQQGLIGELSQRLVALALSEGAKLFEAGFPLEIAVNLSGLWLTDLNLPDFILTQTLAAKLKVDNVMLEVTETGVMEDLATALDVLTRLRLKGFGLSIDDFGIGYSSFEQLGRIPFTEMKLDRSFVSMANRDAAARAILEGSMDMACKLGLSTVAEGVETEQDLELVRTLGCERVQGYLIAKPMPVGDLISWLHARKKTGMEQ